MIKTSYDKLNVLDKETKNKVKEKPADDVEKKNEAEIISKEETTVYVSSDSIEEDSKDE